ncbi:MAG: hypothetical protein ACE5GS_13045 [Kiloniellaceae bacterium]
MTVFRYPTRALVGDYLRAAVGLGVGVGVLASVPATPVIVVVFGGLTTLFLVFGLRTVKRQVTQVAVTNEEICSAAFGTRVVPWRALDRLKLRYYGTRRQRTRGDGAGFMQLTLKGGGASMTLESTIDGFEYIAWRAAKAARDNGISLDPTSAGNLLHLGIDADSDKPAPGGGSPHP